MANKGIIIKGGTVNAESIAVGDQAAVNIQQQTVQSGSSQNEEKKEKPDAHRIFFSYGWGGAGELFINDLYDSLKKDGYTVVRDKMDMGYKGLITEFMKDIGKGQIVIICITDKYLRSEYCMYELYELFRNCRFEKAELVEKIFPVNIEDIKLSKPSIIAAYLNHWNEVKIQWEDLIKSSVAEIGPEQQLRYDRVKKIAVELGSILDLLSDINMLTPDQLSNNDFREIRSAIDAKLKGI